MKGLCFFFFLVINVMGLQKGYAQANALVGNWYSSGTVNIEGSTNNYLGELKLQLKGRLVKGQFNYYFRDSLFTNNIEGIFDFDSRYLVINTFPIILHSSTNTKTGVDCAMTGLFLLRISRVGSYLAGKFTAAPDYKYTCPDISFTFEKSTDEVSPIDVARQAAASAKKDTTTGDPFIAITQKQFDERPKDFFKEVAIDSKSVDIELYDNGQIDYDSVSIFFNNKLMLTKTMLSHKAIKLTLSINDSLPFNEIGMFANNEGLIPPNTATLILIDGDNRYEYEMNSSLNRTAILKLVRRKK